MWPSEDKRDTFHTLGDTLFEVPRAKLTIFRNSDLTQIGGFDYSPNRNVF